MEPCNHGNSEKHGACTSFGASMHAWFTFGELSTFAVTPAVSRSDWKLC